MTTFTLASRPVGDAVARGFFAVREGRDPGPLCLCGYRRYLHRRRHNANASLRAVCP